MKTPGLPNKTVHLLCVTGRAKVSVVGSAIPKDVFFKMEKHHKKEAKICRFKIGLKNTGEISAFVYPDPDSGVWLASNSYSVVEIRKGGKKTWVELCSYVPDAATSTYKFHLLASESSCKPLECEYSVDVGRLSNFSFFNKRVTKPVENTGQQKGEKKTKMKGKKKPKFRKRLFAEKRNRIDYLQGKPYDLAKPNEKGIIEFIFVVANLGDKTVRYKYENCMQLRCGQDENVVEMVDAPSTLPAKDMEISTLEACETWVMWHVKFVPQKCGEFAVVVRFKAEDEKTMDTFGEVHKDGVFHSLLLFGTVIDSSSGKTTPPAIWRSCSRMRLFFCKVFL
jgi:hypothetical protein